MNDNDYKLILLYMFDKFIDFYGVDIAIILLYQFNQLYGKKI